MMTLNAGTLVHQVTIQQLTETDAVDSSGAPAETPWTTLCVAPMGRLLSMRTERGAETVKANELSAVVATRWTMRYLPTMDPDLVDVQKLRRLLYQGRVYDIVAIEPMDRRVGFVIRTIASSKVAA